ncbi:PqqD family protein [Tepidamorphus sp. 3E244]|uniref:PqqD family protein n=1 Tax=Tepidamorphus sp. 3E244 TaxID=3385498 RepID=UPI0038FC0B21
MFYTVFSTNVSPYMQWQSELLEYSWKRVGQEGALVRLVATDRPDRLPQHKYARSVATKLWDVHPGSGDSYPIYNKPASLLEWVYTERPEGTVLLLDPDCVFRRPVTRRVSPGAPIGQNWVDLSVGMASAESPFGLGERFGFLNDHCAATDSRIDPVMIPKLIHTSDLRRIAARWLELCAVVRDNLRSGDGNKVWESDMYAYLAACAEYGLHHEQATLGICPNWDPVLAPDAPLIHYCQEIFDTDGGSIFAKGRYEPWTRLDASQPAAREDGRDLVEIINAFIDDRASGVVTPPPGARPVRRDGVMEGRVLDDMLLEHPGEVSSLWVNASGKIIWEQCDGVRDIAAIGRDLAEAFEADPAALTRDVQAVVAQLQAARLVDLR